MFNKQCSKPLISCIMPTYNRRAFVPHAIRYFLRQDYPAKELIIIDDGTDTIEDLVPQHELIHYHKLPQKITLGAKLNMACALAKGDIIANWDDDDWYAPHRLSYQMQAMQNEQIFICGINKLLYYDLGGKQAFQYVYPPEQRTWLLGSSQCYRKEFWINNRFADINVGMDGLFVWKTNNEHIHVMEDNTFSVHMIHQHNISPKQTNSSWWHPHPAEAIRDIMTDDWPLYSKNGSQPTAAENRGYAITKTKQKEEVKCFKNVYACLVHENEDCVIDLVRNLHYHDPESAIILYDGGGNDLLINSNFNYEKYGAVIYPNPAPVKWGYLHNFALRCMELALKQFTFDAITIVDSDQLCLRKGYTQYLSAYLADHKNIGMLSNKPEKVNRNDRSNPVALQAYNEYELWKPLLAEFPEGENAFVHWTFWPSTVFTADAVKDLVNIFKTNQLLQDIMNQTTIWATEEVILPTLIKLMGYNIGLNPCSYDYVKYKVPYQTKDVMQAMKKENVYWMHPVNRKFEDEVRRTARRESNLYIPENKKEEPVVNNNQFHISDILRINKDIEGWLSDKEAELLINSLIQSLKPQSTVVEIGSYHGKATVLMGAVVKQLFPKAKIYSIDPHDGKLGAADQGYVYVNPSLEKLKHHIDHAGLTKQVDIIQDHAFNVQWDKKITFLLIDGLHDYDNVAKDFHHFSSWLTPGSYIAFHDYADYFPGVKKFVDELLRCDGYTAIGIAESLIVLKKD